MRHNYILLFCLPLLLLAACDGNQNKFTVIGEINDMPEQMVYLEELNINEIVVVDSTETKKNGKFEVSASAPEPGLYRLRFGQGKFILVSVENGNIKISGDWNTLEKHSVSGSPSSASLTGFLKILREHINDFKTMDNLITTFKAQGNDSLLQEATKDMQVMNQEFTRYIEEYADTTKYLPNALFAVQMLNPAVEKEYLGVFIESMNTRFPNASLARDFTAKYSKMMSGTNQPAAPTEGPVVGQQAPDLTLQSTEGKPVSISSFKGKYVLVDFWASWCGPCRKENPNVVAAYNKYKNKNFTVLGISLDDSKDKWQAAIKKDALTWTHVSDLQGWESIAARTYAVEAIPANFLLDPEGKIVARDLRAEELDNKLQELLK